MARKKHKTEPEAEAPVKSAHPSKADKSSEKEKAPKKKPFRNWRSEYLLTYVLLFIFEQFMFHDWRIYEFYKQREFDVGIFDKSNLPIVAHNMKLFTLHQTHLNMSDFTSFVEVDVKDAVKTNKTIFFEEAKFQNYTSDLVMNRVQFRKYLSMYLPERMMWTGIDPVHNDTRERDTHRYYWASKTAKDFIMLTG
mmetsp:Transcript_41863/g.64058  ORF Transcript_41863/g.64058 Transcript_41863/m.64058 type:complete len:194 (-) Transcript_41863:1032-1613(-)